MLQINVESQPAQLTLQTLGEMQMANALLHLCFTTAQKMGRADGYNEQVAVIFPQGPTTHPDLDVGFAIWRNMSTTLHYSRQQETFGMAGEGLSTAMDWFEVVVRAGRNAHHLGMAMRQFSRVRFLSSQIVDRTKSAGLVEAIANPQIEEYSQLAYGLLQQDMPPYRVPRAKGKIL